MHTFVNSSAIAYECEPLEPRLLLSVPYQYAGELDPTVQRVFVHDTALDMVCTEDGGYLVAIADSQWTIAKYTANGTLDPTFGTNGQFKTDLSLSQSEFPNQIRLLPDQKVLITGSVQWTGSNDHRFVMMKLTLPNGAPDASFGGGDGVVISDFTPTDSAIGLGLLPNGKMLIAENSSKVIRFNADGSIDQSYGLSGVATMPGGYSTYAMRMLPDGSVLLGGESPGQQNGVVALGKIDPAGFFNASFGLRTYDLPQNVDRLQQIDIQSDGKIILAGSTETTLSRDSVIARLMPGGDIDSSFGSNGMTLLPFASIVRDLAIDPGDRIIVTTESTENVARGIYRLTASGAPDDAFGDQGGLYQNMQPWTSTFDLNGDIAFMVDSGNTAYLARAFGKPQGDGPVAIDEKGVLIITGERSGDEIRIETPVSAGMRADKLVVTLNGETTQVAIAQITSIAVLARHGADHIEIVVAHDFPLPLSIEAGNEADRIEVFSGSSVAPLTIHSTDEQAGDSKVDTIVVHPGAAVHLALDGDAGIPGDILEVHTGDGNDFVSIGAGTLAVAGTDVVFSGGLELYCEDGEDTITNVGVSRATIRGGDGDDVLLTSGKGSSGYRGDAGTDTARIVGTAGNDTIQVERETFSYTTAAGNGDVSFQTTEFVTFEAGDGNDVIRIRSTDPSIQARLQGDGGSDVFELAPAIASLSIDQIDGVLTLNGGGGADSLLVDDDGDVTGDVLTVSPGVIGSGPADTFFGSPGDTVYHEDIESLELRSSSGADAITLRGAASFTTMTVLTNGGSDRLILDLSQGNVTSSGGIVFNGGLASDSLEILGTPSSESMLSAGATMTLDGNSMTHIQIEQIVFDGKRGFDHVALNGGPGVTFPTAQQLEVLSLDGASIATAASGGTKTILTRSLAMSATATLDLTDNDLIVDYSGSTQAPAIQSLINTARGNGIWLGFGITSTNARATSPRNKTLGLLEASEYKLIYGADATFSGEAIDTTAVLVKFTYYGDVDFNGVVDFDDYSRIDAGFNNNRSGWLNGDVDGNSIVDFDDYSLIDQAFNTQSTPLRPALPPLGGKLGKGAGRALG